MGSLYTSVSATCDYVPTMEYSCRSFAKEVESIYSKYNQSKKALKYHSQVCVFHIFSHVVIGITGNASTNGYLYS